MLHDVYIESSFIGKFVAPTYNDAAYMAMSQWGSNKAYMIEVFYPKNGVMARKRFYHCEIKNNSFTYSKVV